MAPEIMCEESYSNGSDVYAFSMIVYTIITGMASVIALMKKLQTGERQEIPEGTLERCLRKPAGEMLGAGRQ